MIQSTVNKHTARGASFIPHAVNLTVVRPRPLAARQGRDHLHDKDAHHPVDTAHRLQSHTQRIPSKPLVYNFINQRGWAGARNLTASIACLGIGGFLFTHVTSTPGLTVQVALIALLCCCIGLYLLPIAIRDLFGRMRIDSNGIRVSPGFLGFFIPWSELTQWDVNVITFEFRSPKSKSALSTEFRVLSGADRHELREVLRQCAAEKELKIAHVS